MTKQRNRIGDELTPEQILATRTVLRILGPMKAMEYYVRHLENQEHVFWHEQGKHGKERWTVRFVDDRLKWTHDNDHFNNADAAEQLHYAGVTTHLESYGYEDE